MSDFSTPKRTLGFVSARLVQELQKKGKLIFTLEDACKIYTRPRSETAKFLSDLIGRGVLARLKAGVYLILQVGQESTQLSNWPIIARELAKPNKYFISHYSAMRILGMTSHPLIDVYITMPKRHRNKKINNITYHFIYAKPEHFSGFSDTWVTKQEKVFVSDIERTLLDGLERPDLCGGIKEVFRGIWIKRKEIDWEKLIKYARVFRTKAAIKRLGFVLELLGMGDNYLPIFIEMVSAAKDYVFLDPYGLKEGKYMSRWRIRLNISIEELKASIW